MLYSIIFIFVSVSYCMDVPLLIDLFKPKTFVDDKFLSVTFGGSIVKHRFNPRLINLKSRKLIALANGLTQQGTCPESYLRLGGADKSFFDPTMYKLNITELNLLCKFVDTLGWKLIIGLNVLFRNADGSWDPSNAIQLITYLKERNFTAHYELGNEPDLFPTHLNITIPPQRLAKDFILLREILNNKVGLKTMLFGPDIASLTRYNYFADFLMNIPPKVLSAITFHHYYSSSKKVTVENFTDVKYLDGFLTKGLEAMSIIKTSFSSFPHPPVWLGETSSTYGGGSISIGESYAAGFLWLDKLGLAAQMNISVVLRQCLKGGHYSLLYGDYEPSPDYWTSLLYKRLMGSTVLGLTGYLEYNREVRLYGHCINRNGRHDYEPYSLVLMFLNLNNTEKAYIRFLMNDWTELIADLYLFQPAFGDLTDKYVTLNGVLLKMIDETTLPVLNPVRVQQPYIIPPLSYGFLVVLGASVPACE